MNTEIETGIELGIEHNFLNSELMFSYTEDYLHTELRYHTLEDGKMWFDLLTVETFDLRYGDKSW